MCLLVFVCIDMFVIDVYWILVCCCHSDDEPGEDKEFANVTLKDIVRVETLGMGGFGRVELVKISSILQFTLLIT